MSTTFVLIVDEARTPFGTLVKEWKASVAEDDPRRDVFLELCEKGIMEVVPKRSPRRRAKPKN